MSTTTITTADEVRALYERIRKLDPGAYSGFVSDAAVRHVAREHGLRSTDVLRDYRKRYPAKGSFRLGGRKPTPEAVERAIAGD